MIEDEVVREVRAAREAFAASHGFDIRKMVAALHELGVASGRELVQFAPRPPLVGPNQALVPTRPAIAASESPKVAAAAPADDLAR
jgi:hypothetical protein